MEQVVQYKEQEDSVNSLGEESSFLEKSVGKLLSEVFQQISPKAHKFSGKDVLIFQ